MTMPGLITFIIIGICTPSLASAGRPGRSYSSLEALAQAPQTPAAGNGRVTLTLALEGIRIPNVNVALRSVDGDVVVA
jgi:hypothetical protein